MKIACNKCEKVEDIDRLRNEDWLVEGYLKVKDCAAIWVTIADEKTVGYKFGFYDDWTLGAVNYIGSHGDITPEDPSMYSDILPDDEVTIDYMQKLFKRQVTWVGCTPYKDGEMHFVERPTMHSYRGTEVLDTYVFPELTVSNIVLHDPDTGINYHARLEMYPDSNTIFRCTVLNEVE